MSSRLKPKCLCKFGDMLSKTLPWERFMIQKRMQACFGYAVRKLCAWRLSLWSPPAKIMLKMPAATQPRSEFWGGKSEYYETRGARGSELTEQLHKNLYSPRAPLHSLALPRAPLAFPRAPLVHPSRSPRPPSRTPRTPFAHPSHSPRTPLALPSRPPWGPWRSIALPRNLPADIPCVAPPSGHHHRSRQG